VPRHRLEYCMNVVWVADSVRIDMIWYDLSGFIITCLQDSSWIIPYTLRLSRLLYDFSQLLTAVRDGINIWKKSVRLSIILNMSKTGGYADVSRSFKNYTFFKPSPIGAKIGTGWNRFLSWLFSKIGSRLIVAIRGDESGQCDWGFRLETRGGCDLYLSFGKRRPMYTNINL
jgi:hypothetical protein